MDSAQANILTTLINAYVNSKVTLAEIEQYKSIRGSSGPNFDQMREGWTIEVSQTKMALMQYINSLTKE